MVYRIPLEVHPDLTQKFESKAVKSKNFDECWGWRGNLTGAGYPIFSHNNISLRATRYSYVLYCGALATDKDVCHTCDNPSCVNPFHLRQATHSINMRDKVLKRRHQRYKKDRYYGVYFEKENERYVSRLNKKIIGVHVSAIDAARNYDRMAYIVNGERDMLNFREEYGI